ncbi:MAG: phospholipid carrier-dependent glycosyltransferase [Oscillatoriales cyanobacterium SM2_2_1]|nr:phospholipid carrier-dependent glycosyltransferase [Oscillatoriales cyanobacterium SM2_2_1]
MPLAIAAWAIYGLALGLRLWDLDRQPYPVFDEVHFPKFASEYLGGSAPLDGHPPLGKYVIMLGIWLFGANDYGYRLMTALVGAALPLLVMGLMYRLTARYWIGAMAAIFVALDGLFLVESRFGLMNIFLVTFGLASQVFLVAALLAKDRVRTGYGILSGLMLGASASVKWNGLGFWLLTVLLFGMTLVPWWQGRLGLWQKLRELRWWESLLLLGVAPGAVYGGQWLPHVLMVMKRESPTATGWDWWQALGFHFVQANRYIVYWNNSTAAVGTPDQPIHPYCSAMQTWPISWRPVGYFFEVKNNLWWDVHGMGNPVLWWLAIAAVLWFTARGLAQIRQFESVTAYLLLGYAANYLPWLLVKRCLFVYHYMSPVVFAFMLLAVGLGWLWSRQQHWVRFVGIFGGVGIGLSTLFFMPIWLGLPLTEAQFFLRMWLKSWI